MLNTDEEALVCDLAETYQIYDYRSLSCKKIATFSCGLRNDSRIKMKLAGSEFTTSEMMLASIVDNVRLLLWCKTEDGMHGINRPESIVRKIVGISSESEREYLVFNSGDEFEKEWKQRIGGTKNE